MKILFIQKEGGIFGAEQFQLQVIPSLLQQGVEIHFLRLYTHYQGGKGGDFIHRLQQMGVPTFEVHIGRWPSPLRLYRMWRIIQQGQYAIVHSHLIHADLYVSLVKRLNGFKAKFVSTKHGYDNVYTAQYGFNPAYQSRLRPYFVVSRFSERTVHKSITISHGLRNFFIATGLAKPEVMTMIHYGFDIPEPKPLIEVGSYRLFKQQIIIAGRLVGFKGHRYLLQALPIIHQQFPQAGIVIAGIGAEEEALRARVTALGITEKVHFLGYSKEVPQWMATSDVVAIPSISEGFGVVFLEAFAARTPVVSFDVPAGNELMQHGVTGFLAKPYEVEDLARQIIHILSHPEEMPAVTEAAYQRLRTYFTLDRMVQETMVFYRGVLSRGIVKPS